MRIKANIFDPRGNTVKEASYTLNAYGSFSDILTLDKTAPLGEYRIEIRTENNGTHLSNATLFRLEEYKLPEFIVNIKPKPKQEEDGKDGTDAKKAVSSYRLGDTIEVELDAQYYFGPGESSLYSE